jgi:hypothetical protein
MSGLLKAYSCADIGGRLASLAKLLNSGDEQPLT